MANILLQFDEWATALVSQAQRSLVRIANGRLRGAGSGVICRADGLILTNNHVVQRRSLHVTLPDGRQLPARLLASDPENDLAALGIEATHLPAVVWGDSRTLRPGDLAFALGHPWGVHNAVAAGVVIGVGAEWPEMPRNRRDLVMVSLRLRPGNSGGPLVDHSGRLIGINTLMTGPEAGAAVPAHVAQDFLYQIGAQNRQNR